MECKRLPRCTARVVTFVIDDLTRMYVKNHKLFNRDVHVSNQENSSTWWESGKIRNRQETKNNGGAQRGHGESDEMIGNIDDH